MSAEWFKYDVEFFMRLRVKHGMSNAEFGALLALLEHYWKEPFVPFKPSVLARVTGQKSSKWKPNGGQTAQNWELFGVFFVCQNSNNLVCPYLDIQKEKMAQKSGVRRVAAMARWGYAETQADANACANADANGMQKKIEKEIREEQPPISPKGEWTLEEPDWCGPTILPPLPEPEQPDLFTQTDDPKSKRRRKASKAPKATEADFDAFWAAYPRRVGKGAAKKKFLETITADMVDRVIQAAEAYREQIKDNPDMAREGGKFIPHPSTWLNQGRFDDEGLAGDLEPKDPNEPNLEPLPLDYYDHVYGDFAGYDRDYYVAKVGKKHERAEWEKIKIEWQRKQLEYPRRDNDTADDEWEAGLAAARKRLAEWEQTNV